MGFCDDLFWVDFDLFIGITGNWELRASDKSDMDKWMVAIIRVTNQHKQLTSIPSTPKA